MLILGGVGVSVISGENGLFSRTNDSLAGYDRAEDLEDKAFATLMKYFSGTLSLTGEEAGDVTVDEQLLRGWIDTLVTEALVEKLGYVKGDKKLFDTVGDLEKTLDSNITALTASVEARATKAELEAVDAKIEDTTKGNEAIYNAVLKSDDSKSLINRIQANENNIGTKPNGKLSLYEEMFASNGTVQGIDTRVTSINNIVTSTTNGNAKLKELIDANEEDISKNTQKLTDVSAKLGTQKGMGTIYERLANIETLKETWCEYKVAGTGIDDDWKFLGYVKNNDLEGHKKGHLYWKENWANASKNGTDYDTLPGGMSTWRRRCHSVKQVILYKLSGLRYA